MLKAQYERRGPVPQDVIAPVEFDAPKLETGQVLIEVLAAPINPSDVLTLTGEYGMLPPLPAVGGNEGVGRIAAKGSDGGPLPVGQTVLLPIGIGTWASHVVAAGKQLVPLPNEADPLRGSAADVVLVDGDDLARRVTEATGRARIRLAIDAVGGDATGRLSDCLAEGGIVVNYGALSEADAPALPAQRSRRASPLPRRCVRSRARVHRRRCGRTDRADASGPRASAGETRPCGRGSR